jgi:hypothetical protein
MNLKNISTAVLVATVLGCSGSVAQECTPGQQTSCECPGGSESVQTCAADGESYGACEACGSPGPCTPGAQMPCTCPGGTSSVEVCAADGASYGACEGCGAVPVVPAGAWTVELTQGPNPAGCAIEGGNTMLGDVDADMRDAIVTNGVGDASISCDVAANDDGSFNINAEGDGNGDSFSMTIPSIQPSATKTTPAMGSGTYASQATAGNAYGSSACDFYFIPGTGEGVAAGSVWLAFDCPQVQSEMSTCEIPQGYALFEYCSTVAPM